MKKIFLKSLVGLAALVAASGCIEETLPQGGGVTKEQVSKSDAAIGSMLNSLPANMTSSFTLFGWRANMHFDFGLPGIHLMTEFMLEDIATMAEEAGYNQFFVWASAKGMSADAGYNSYFWVGYYNWIKITNDIIGLIDLNTSDPELQSMLGQALTYRASFYLDLARLYEPKENDYVTVSDKIKGLTVPLVTEKTKEADATNNPRVPRAQMYSFILNDLENAARLLKGKPFNYTTPSEFAAYGLMARAYLEMGAAGDPDAYEKAIQCADKVLEGSKRTPLTQSEWEDPNSGFNDGSKNNSWIWGLPVSTENVNNIVAFTSHMSSEAQYGYCVLTHIGVSKALYERISDKDFRKHSWLDPKRFDYYDYKFAGTKKDIKALLEGDDEIQLEPIMDYATLKFRCREGSVTNPNPGNAADHVLMRIEEMYFIKAEALAQLDHVSEAVAVLNSLINTRYSDKSYDAGAFASDKAGFLEHMLLQKRIEFWGEGILMFDYKRLDHGIKRAYEGSNHAPVFALNCEGRSPQWNIPITIDETQNNKAIPVDLNNPDPSQFVTPTPFEK